MVPERPLYMVDIGSIVASEARETTPLLKSLGSLTEVKDHSCVEGKGLIKAHECVPRDFKELCSIPTPPCWECGGRSCVDSLCVCASGIETSKGTSDE